MFFSRNSPFRKVEFLQLALMFVAMAAIQLFGLIVKTRILIIFQVSSAERNVLWDNMLCFLHHITLKSLIKANILSVTVERFQKIALPKYGH